MAHSLSSAAAVALTRRCISSSLTRRCPRVARMTVGGIIARNDAPHDGDGDGVVVVAAARLGLGASGRTAVGTVRHSSGSTSPPPAVGGADDHPGPPSSLTAEAGLGAQDAMKFFVRHGLGRQKLASIAADAGSSPLVERWQRMIAAYLETQCHVIALLGYRPDEVGISMYTQHVQHAMTMSSPEDQEQLRIAMRDTYRLVLAGAFDVPTLMEDQRTRGELSIIDARNIMHKVSLRMLEPDVLEKVRDRCSVSVAMNDSPEAQQIELARKHTVVQEVMVTDVYLSEKDGMSLVEECGFGAGEAGYVRMQCALAEHQGDPLITQYVGAAIVRLLQSAGIDMEALQKQAQQLQRNQ